jgi:urea transport system substrate-binding protein
MEDNMEKESPHVRIGSKAGQASRSRARMGAVLLTAASLALAGCGAESKAAGSGTVKIGVLAPITGSLAPYGEALQRGMGVAVELINADGGIGGKQVEYVLEDDQTDPKTAATQARKLLTQDRVNVLMGTTSSPTTLAAIPHAESAKVPFIYIAEGEAKTCEKSGTGSRKFVFGNGVTPEQKMEEFVPYLVNNIGKNVYFIGSDYVFPHFVNDLTSGLVKEAGGSVAGVDYAPLGTTDFSSYIAKIEKANPEVIFISVVGSDGVALVKQLNQFGLADKVKLTGIPTFAAEALAGIAPVAQGVYTVDPYWEGLENEVNQKFVKAYREKYPDDAPVSPMAAQGAYGTLLLLKAAAEKSGSVEGPALAEALPGTTVQSPGGEITVDDNHVVKTPMQLLQVEGSGYKRIQDLGSISHNGFAGCSSKDL